MNENDLKARLLDLIDDDFVTELVAIRNAIDPLSSSTFAIQLDALLTNVKTVRSYTSFNYAAPIPGEEPLWQAKETQKALINGWRDEAEWAGCETPLGRMDTDVDSQRKLNGAVLMAQIAMANDEPFSINWTMSDDTDVEHDGPQLIAAGVAVGTHVSACHEISRMLKLQVDAVTDEDGVEAVRAITWPQPELVDPAEPELPPAQ